MRKLFHYKFIIVVLIILIFPIILNFVLQLSIFNTNIIGDEKLWLTFWSSYLGAIIMSIITLFVLYKTLKQNQNNHKRLTKFQIETINTQAKKEWFFELKKLIINNLSTLNFENVNTFLNQIKIMSLNNDILKDISLLEEKIKKLEIEFKIIYHNEFPHSEQAIYKSTLEKIINEYLKFLNLLKEKIIEFDKKIETIFRLDDIKTILVPKDKIDVEFLKDKHLKTGLEIKEKLGKLIENQKKGVIALNSVFEKVSMDLIKFEENKIFEKLKKID